MGDTIGLFWGEGVPKKYFKNNVFGSVFRYLKVALRLKVCVDTTIGLVLLPLHLTLTRCLLVFLVVGTSIVLVAFQLGWFSAPTLDRCFIPFIGFLLLGADNHALQRKKVQESAAVWL